MDSFAARGAGEGEQRQERPDGNISQVRCERLVAFSLQSAGENAPPPAVSWGERSSDTRPCGSCSVCQGLRRKSQKAAQGHRRRGHIHLAGWVALPDTGCGKLRFLAQADSQILCVAVTRHWSPGRQKPQLNDLALAGPPVRNALFIGGLEVGWQEGSGRGLCCSPGRAPRARAVHTCLWLIYCVCLGFTRGSSRPQAMLKEASFALTRKSDP